MRRRKDGGLLLRACLVLGAVCDGWVVVLVLYRVGCGDLAKSVTC